MDDKKIRNEYKWTSKFEECIANFCKSPYAIAVDCCTNAIQLSLDYTGEYKVTLPRRTYIGVYQAARHCGLDVEFKDIEWEIFYKIEPTNVYDCACYFERRMYIPGSIMCLSFSYKKRLPIGRGGMILTDDCEFKNWCVKSRNLGKDINVTLQEQTYEIDGWNMLMHPDLAKKGLELFKNLSDSKLSTYRDYPDLESQIKWD